MPKRAKELSALAVSRLNASGYHAVGGVAGLHLQVVNTNARSWILRTTIGGKRKEIGLGAYPDTPLADAREKARKVKADIESGINPIEAKREARSKLASEVAKAISFKEAASAYITAHESGWKNAKHAAQWTSTLETYAYPIIGSLHVKDVTLPHILKILEPIWTTKTETASRLRGRLASVLNWSKVRGYRSGDNPAEWKGNLDQMLPAPSKVANAGNHAALHHDDIGDFMIDLRKIDGMGARALEFAILTATRSGEVRGATWDEIDLDKAVWIIPKERMKAGKEHHVPLSPEVVKLLKALPDSDGKLIFPGRNGQLSDMSLTAALKRMNRKDLTAHGFRSTFRDWAGERTNYPEEVCNHALAHKLKDKADAAYQRGSLFPKRIALMRDWAKYCAMPSVKNADNVTNINEKVA